MSAVVVVLPWVPATGDATVAFQEFTEHHGSPHHGDPSPGGGDELVLVLGNRCRVDHGVDAFEVAGVVSDVNLDPQRREPLGAFRRSHIAPAHHGAAGMRDLGETAHSRPRRCP